MKVPYRASCRSAKQARTQLRQHTQHKTFSIDDVRADLITKDSIR